MNSAPKSDVPNCPVCASPCCDAPLETYTAHQAAKHFCPPTRDENRFVRLEAAIRRLWGGDTCVVLRCAECGFAFGSPFVGGDEEFYAILHEQRGYPKWRWDYDVALREVVARTSPGRVLDVGAGAGAFLDSFDAPWERFAAEGSESTRRELERRGITVFRDLVEAGKAHRGTFQLITMFQVLEHLSEFPTYLAAARDLLRPGGALVLTVPDADAMLRQPAITGAYDTPPNHINKFTPRSLALVLARPVADPQPATAQPPA